MANTPVLHHIFSVQETPTPSVFLVGVDLTDSEGDRYEATYVLYQNDTVGLAPQVQHEVEKWIEAGNAIDPPPAPPNPEKRRGMMENLSPRQTIRALLSIGITEKMVEEGLSGAPEALIDWRWATEFKRLHPLVVSLAEYFELPAEQVDSLWEWAADL